MVSRAGKELLRNTIRLVGHHNKIIEEQEMWKKWELARGLTMMVTDETSPSTSHERRRTKEKHKRKYKPLKGVAVNVAQTPQKSDKWDHSGFMELYPDIKERKLKKWNPPYNEHLKDSKRVAPFSGKGRKLSSKKHLRDPESKRRKIPCKKCLRKRKNGKLPFSDSSSISEEESSFRAKRIKPCGETHIFHKVNCEGRSKRKGLCFSSVECRSSKKQRTFTCAEDLESLREAKLESDISDSDVWTEKMDPRL